MEPTVPPSTELASTRSETSVSSTVRRKPPHHTPGVKLVLLAARLIFMALVLVTPALVVSSRADPYEAFPLTLVIGLTLATGAIGLIVVMIDTMTPNKRLASIFGIYLGICLGLVGAYAIGTLLDSMSTLRKFRSAASCVTSRFPL